jgi:hypothetical protein
MGNRTEEGTQRDNQGTVKKARLFEPLSEAENLDFEIL